MSDDLRHLEGRPLPSGLAFSSTHGDTFDLSAQRAGLLVAYVYPRTGKPGEPLPEGWDAIPGARGCTPQSCAFRDHVSDLAVHGASVVGISAQTTEDQREFATREHIPFPLLSDPGLRLAKALELPTFAVAGMVLYRRVTLVVDEGRIAKVFYPVDPPEANADEVLQWLATRSRS